MNEIADELTPGQGQPSSEELQNSEPQPDTASQADNEELKTLRLIAERQARQIQQLVDATNEERNRPAPPPPPPPVQIPDKTEDPVGHLTAVMEQRISALQQQMMESQKPLQDFTRSQQNQQLFANAAVAIAEEVPQLKDQAFWTQLYQQLPSSFTPTPENVRLAALTYYGQLALVGKAPTGVSSSKAPDSGQPPLPPRHNTSRPNTQAPTPELNEGQRRAMLRAGFKAGEEQKFLDYIGQETRTIDMGYTYNG
jgi:hypothetical protein